MKLGIISANGRVGQYLVEEALERGLDVTAIVRGHNRTKADKAILKDIMSLNKEDLHEFDAVISAFGTWDPKMFPNYTTYFMHISDLLANTQTRFLVVGGAGSLFTDDSMTMALYEKPTFSSDFYPLAKATADSLKALRNRNDVLWTYVSPATDFRADGEKTGQYIVAGEVFQLNDKGVSRISYADYAKAMIDEVLEGNHIQERISFIGK